MFPPDFLLNPTFMTITKRWPWNAWFKILNMV